VYIASVTRFSLCCLVHAQHRRGSMLISCALAPAWVQHTAGAGKRVMLVEVMKVIHRVFLGRLELAW
jgi:hypothetical protein